MTQITAPAPDAAEIPATMRAWVFNSVQNGLENSLTLEATYPIPDSFRNLPVPASKGASGSVLVRVLAASVNPVDYKIPELPVVGAFVPRRPATPAVDFCGRVVATTDPRFAAGQLVAGKLDNMPQHGALAEYAVAPADGCALVPAGVAVEQAATIGVCGMTAWSTLVPHIAKLKNGTAANCAAPIATPRVFINGGSGGVGVYAIALAKHLLGCHVTTACSAGNAALVRAMGADDVIDYRTENVAEALVARATATATATATTPGGRPFDFAVDTVGLSFDLYKAGDTFLAPHGTFAQVAFKSLAETVRVSLRPSFLGGGQRSAPMLMGRATPETFPGLLDLMATGKLTIPLEEVIPFEEAPRAYAQLKTHRTRGKVVVRVAEEK